MDSIDRIKDHLKIWDVANRYFGSDMPSRCGLYHAPFREDENESFSVFAGGDMAKDHATGESYDIIDLLVKQGGVPFRQALGMLSGWSGVTLENRIKRSKPKPRGPKPMKRKPANLARISNTLNDAASKSHPVFTSLAARKRWPTEYIEALIKKGVIGTLGDGSIGWLMERGIKFRGNAHNTKKDGWLCGKSTENLFLTQLYNPKCGTVFITEGETDSISILFSGVCQHGKASVLGVCGAGVKPHIDLIKPLVSGKLVVLCGDNDKAGRAFLDRMTKHLKLMGVTPRYLNWGDHNHNDIGDMYVSEGADALAYFIGDDRNYHVWSTNGVGDNPNTITPQEP